MTSPTHGASDAARLMDTMYRYQRYIYDATRKFYLLGRDGLIQRLAPPSGGKVLEVGCGTGRNLVAAARSYDAAELFGLDVSAVMLDSARQAIARAGLTHRIHTAQADATSFDATQLFGVASFDRIFVSYALSMIPNWQAAVARACECLAENASLHIVDFGDQAGLPAAFRLVLEQWLALFSVHPCKTLEAELAAFAAQREMHCKFERRFRGYAFYAVLTMGAARERIHQTY
jgi:S-adenosylmethionine-diacylgycerolhomoserine-N-methlytransferase